MVTANFNQPSKGQLSSNGTAFEVINDGNGSAVSGESKGNGAGVWGTSHGDQAAVVGIADKGPGVYGESKLGGNNAGVWAVSHGDQAAVVGIADNGGGVFGESKGNSAGVWGTSHRDQAAVVGIADNAAGVFGESKGNSAGVWGTSHRDQAAVVGIADNAAGVYAETSGNGAAIVGISRRENPNERVAGYFDGRIDVRGDVVLLNADCAEEFEISPTENIEPGTVMVLNQSGNLEQSYQAYDKKVIGIVAGAGNYKPAIVLDKKENSPNKTRLPISLMGKVYCKVDAAHCPIEIGDLLTSSTKGYAMKANDHLRAFGSVIGKALQPLKEGQGIIPILVALQ